jgi:hypothetical protein
MNAIPRWRDGITHLVMQPLEFMKVVSGQMCRIHTTSVPSADDGFASLNLGCWMPGLGRRRVYADLISMP